jgi:hypothetical protein
VGEAQQPVFEPGFNRAVKVQEGDDRLTSDAGVLLLREADHRLALIESLANNLHDARDQELVRYQLPELLRQRIYSLALGYSAQDDLDRLAHDPAMRMASWDRPGEEVLEQRLASQPTHSRLIDMLAHDRHNLQTLRGALGDWTERRLRSTSDHAVRHGTIDIDSFPSEVHGRQEGAAYNGCYRALVYHPIVVFGDNYSSPLTTIRIPHGFLLLSSLPSGVWAKRREAVGRPEFRPHVDERDAHLAQVRARLACREVQWYRAVRRGSESDEAPRISRATSARAASNVEWSWPMLHGSNRG